MLQEDWREPPQIGGMLTLWLMLTPTPSHGKSSEPSSGGAPYTQGFDETQEARVLCPKARGMSVIEYRDKFI